MKIRYFNKDFESDWQRLVEASDDAWIFHDSRWLKVTEEIWSLESKSFLIEHEKKIVGLMPLQMRPNKKLTSIYFGTGGAVVDNNLAESFKRKVYQYIYSEVHRLAAELQSPSVEVLLAPLSPTQLESRWHVNPLVEFGFEDTSTHTWMLDLSVDEESLKNNFSDDAKQNIRKAKSLGFSVKHIQPQNYLDLIYQIHCENYKRTQVAPHPKKYFQAIIDHVFSLKRAHFFIVEDKNSYAVAYEILGFFKKSAQYWAGACLNNVLETGVNYLLQEHCLLWAKSQKATWFNHGEAFPNTHDPKLRGLTVFKGKFGGELHRNFKGMAKINQHDDQNLVSKVKSRFRRAKTYFMNRK